MPTFVEDWKKAKTAFQTATGKKKPSASFLGAFNKSSGITPALEKADKAKTAGDLETAMIAFQKTYIDYLKVLEKAIADPKTTPVADKPTYAEAAKKLKLALEAIHDSAHEAMEPVVGKEKKERVDPAQLKKEADQRIKEEQQRKDDEKQRKEWADGEKVWTAHIQRRNALAKTFSAALSGYKSKGVEAAVANAIKQSDAAKSAKEAKNTMGADVAAQTSTKFSDQASTLFAEIPADWKKVSLSPEALALRLNPGASVPPEKAAQLTKDSSAAWHLTETVQRDVNTYIATLRALVAQATAAAEAAEVYMIGKQTPASYIKRIDGMLARFTEIEVGPVGKVAGKVQATRVRNKELAQEYPKKDASGKAANKTQWGQVKGEFEAAVPQAVKGLEELKEIDNRLKLIPQDDKAVVDKVNIATTELAKIQQLVSLAATEGALFIKELESYLKLGESAPTPTAKPQWATFMGLRWPCTEDEMTKAYRKLALQYHPDKHQGNPENLKKVTEYMKALNNHRDTALVYFKK